MRTLINLLVLTVAGRLSAQTFLDSLNIPAGNAPANVITGDFNCDGKLNIVVSNSGSSSISVFLGIGDGSFRSRRDFVLGSQPQALASDDFNGDGKLDLAVVSGLSNSVLILLGNGDGTFLPAISTSVAGPTALAVADFDGDGKLDLAVASSASNSVQILFGRGNGSFLPSRSVSVGINPVSLAVGDFNSDGRTDMAVAHGGSPFVSILVGDGHGDFCHERRAVRRGPQIRCRWWRPAISLPRRFERSVTVSGGNILSLSYERSDWPRRSGSLNYELKAVIYSPHDPPNDRGAISDSAQRGQSLFFSDEVAGCFRCHGGFNFSDATVYEGSGNASIEFHNTGL